MRGFLFTVAFFGSYWVACNLPAEWSTLFGLVTLAVMLTTAIALAVKWVRNA